MFQGDEAERVNVQAWVYDAGIPANMPQVSSTAFTAVEGQVDSWKSGATASSLKTAGWSSHEWLHFLRAMPDSIPADRLADLDRTFKLSQSGNSEILFAWLRIAIRTHYTPAMPALEKFLTSQGRRKFLAPLYTDLARTDWGRSMATTIYRRARPTYHSVSVGTIDGILDWKTTP